MSPQMEKDFISWNKKKILLNLQSQNKNLYFYERDVWWAALGQNIGFEQDGKGEEFLRPVLIIKKFNHLCVLVLPLSSKIKESKYYLKCYVKCDNKPRSVIISQIRLIDSKRLTHKLGTMSQSEFSVIIKAVKDML